ncbi:MAG: hypothetical protein SGJ27_29400 [Candidatus Melainabacteria bacterium]|nr:hypothetical protein [Candidatus Melainabacteria bacterium]
MKYKKLLFNAIRGMANNMTMAANCPAVAVVPAQCQRRPSHQKVGAIFHPIRLDGYKQRPLRRGTNDRVQPLHLNVSVNPYVSSTPQLHRGHG